MFFSQSDDDAPKVVEVCCSDCEKPFHVQYGILINTIDLLECLEQGTILDKICPHCESESGVHNIVKVSIPDLWIGDLWYVPSHALENPEICECMISEGIYQSTYYSIEELLRQIHARIRLFNYVAEELEHHPEFLQQRWPHIT